MGEVFLDAFLDTLKVLPFLLIMNFAIELLEYRSKGFKTHKALNGKLAPLIGTAVGVVPQCGFSVVATELYAKRRIALGTLLAVYIATSDEALPIMLSSYAGLQKVLPVIVIKVLFALVVGYAVFFAQKSLGGAKRQKGERVQKAEQDRAHLGDARSGDGQTHVHGCHSHALDGEGQALADNATKKQKAARVWKLYIEHPLLHTATVVLYIFIVNIVFGVAVYYVGESRLAAFVGSTGYLQPFLAAAVGLIPNCAASVVITELYVIGGLGLGGAIAGLCVGAGIGYAVLVKQNRPIKQSAAIIAAMYVISALFGIAVDWIYPMIFA